MAYLANIMNHIEVFVINILHTELTYGSFMFYPWIRLTLI